MSSFPELPSLFLDALHIRSFRNIALLTINCEPGLNLFLGPNGHGKTNCLEAISLSLSLRPMQSLKNSDLIRFDDEKAHLLANFNGDYPMELAVDIMPQGKKARLNHQGLRNACALSKRISVVSFIPAELAMVQGGANLRRRALDQAAGALFFEHESTLKAYEKILLNRNKLLKSWPLDYQSLHVFTELLIKEGASLIHGRLKTLLAMQDIFQEKIHAILGPHCSAGMSYQMRDRDLDQHTAADIMALLANNAQEMASLEHRRKITLFGPHLDDVMFLLNAHDARKTASRGQSRALVLSFKLAHMIAAERIRGIAPLIILDDIVSELDATTKTNLLNTVSDLKTQSFFSATDLNSFGGLLKPDRIFELREGVLLTSPPPH